MILTFLCRKARRFLVQRIHLTHTGQPVYARDDLLPKRFAPLQKPVWVCPTLQFKTEAPLGFAVLVACTRSVAAG